MPGEMELAREVVERLADIPGSLRQIVIDAMWARIPSTVNEFAYVANAAAATAININRQTDQLELIDTIVAICGTGGATLKLGNFLQIPLVAGVNNLGPGLHIILGPSDVRSITPAQQANTFVMLCGQQLPTTGVEAP
jgi:hypothetical protein